MVICVEQGADLHMAQLMPLPLTVSCFSKIQIGFTFLVLAHRVVPDKGLLNVCVCQVTDSKILQEYITQEGHKLEIAPKPPMAVTNAVSWRSEGLKYRKNEVFLDVVESVNLLVSASGNVLRSEIVGAIKMRVYLSGMPELRLGLNDKVHDLAV